MLPIVILCIILGVIGILLMGIFYLTDPRTWEDPDKVPQPDGDKHGNLQRSRVGGERSNLSITPRPTRQVDQCGITGDAEQVGVVLRDDAEFGASPASRAATKRQQRAAATPTGKVLEGRSTREADPCCGGGCSANAGLPKQS